MKTEQEIKEKQIEMLTELMNAIEACDAFESSFGKKPTDEENESMMLKVAMLKFGNSTLNWILE